VLYQTDLLKQENEKIDSLWIYLDFNLLLTNQTDLIILDFSKAFDKVPHKKLLWKLNNYGIRGNTWKWVSAFLSNRMQQVALDGEVSGQLPV
jgi:hypothetical protein